MIEYMLYTIVVLGWVYVTIVYVEHIQWLRSLHKRMDMDFLVSKIGERLIRYIKPTVGYIVVTLICISFGFIIHGAYNG